MKDLDTTYWAGTELALVKYMDGEKQDKAQLQAAYGSQDKTDGEPPRLFSQHGDVGVVTISGSLVNSDSWMNEFVGRTGYPEIRDALIHAATDPSVGAIVLDINSGGGAVSGVADTAALIKRIDAEIKPVHTFSDGMIASAAYWLGSSARSVEIGSVTEAGSIGVLTVHKEISKSLEMDGIKATVLKAGEFKAAGNQYEPLSDKARAEIQSQLDYMYQMFVQAVAENRKVSYPVADTKLAQGRVFIGTQAVDVGLVDGVSTFDSVISKVQGGIDSRKSSSQYGANFSKGTQMKQALTEQQVAALAELGALTPVAAAALAVANPGGGSGDAPAADAAAAASANAAAEGAASGAAEGAAASGDAAASAAAPAAAPAAPASTELTAFLKTSLAEAQAAVTDMTLKLRDAVAAKEAMGVSHAALRSIAEASVDRLKVALGGSAGGASALSDESLLAEHATLRAQLETKFKVGGVAAVSSSAEANKADDYVDPVRQARINSTRTTAK